MTCSTSPPGGNPGWRFTAGFDIIRLRGSASWNSKKCWPIYNLGCYFRQVDEFVHNDLYTFVIFLLSSTKKKTRELTNYSFARAKWAGQFPTNFPKSWYFDDIMENFRNLRFFVKNEEEFKGSSIIAGGLALRVLPAETRLTVYRRLRVARKSDS